MAGTPFLVSNEVAKAVIIYPENRQSTVPIRIVLDYGYDEPAEYRLDEDYPYRVR